MNIKNTTKYFLLGVAILLVAFLIIPKAEARSGCCSYHGGVCGCGCCDGSPLSSTCSQYYPECNSKPKVTPPKVVAPTITYSYPEEKSPIQFDKKTQDDPGMIKGETKVSQIGVVGERTIYYKITYSNGTQTSKDKTDEKITKQPVDEITLVGIKEKPIEQPEADKPSDSIKKSWPTRLWDWFRNIFN